MNIHSSLLLPSPTPFLKGEIKFPKKWVGGANLKKNCIGNQKGVGNAKVTGNCDFFIFIFSLLAMMVTVFRKSSLEDLLLKSGPGYF